MAKNFPYFKFVVTEWMTGDIVFESLSVQGLFINICALYWQRDGVLTVSDINKRFKNPEELTELTDRFFSVNDGFVSVKFLDEQLIEANHISKKNSENGSKGGRPKKTEKNPPLSELNPTQSQKKQSKEELKKSKEEKELNNNKIFIDNSVFLNESLMSAQWIEATASQSKITLEGVKFFLNHFDEHLIITQEQKNELQEYKRHFSSWLRKQDVSMFSNGYNGKTNQI